MKKMRFFIQGILLVLLFATSNAFAGTARSAQTVIQNLKNEVHSRALTMSSKGSHYFFIPFAYQGVGNPANQSHTFASVVEVTESKKQIWHTISWLPEDFDKTKQVCIFRNFFYAVVHEIAGSPCGPVKGKNFTLVQSLTWGLEQGMTTAVWGPYAITAEMHKKFLERKQSLDKGSRFYQADDRELRGEEVAVNCMHAVGDLAYPYSFATKYGFGTWGIRGTQYILLHQVKSFSQWFFDKPDINKFRTY